MIPSCDRVVFVLAAALGPLASPSRGARPPKLSLPQQSVQKLLINLT